MPVGSMTRKATQHINRQLQLDIQEHGTFVPPDLLPHPCPGCAPDVGG
jgi:hypothetical protein